MTGSDVSHVTGRDPVRPYYFFPYFFVAKFEIQRFKTSVSCFSSTCRYYTVHVPCGISIQTSPVGLPLDGWGARMRDLKGPKMNLFNPKEDWNLLLYQPIISLEIEPIRSRHFRPISQSETRKKELISSTKCWLGVFSTTSASYNLLRTSPFTGYLPFICHFHI